MIPKSFPQAATAPAEPATKRGRAEHARRPPPFGHMLCARGSLSMTTAVGQRPAFRRLLAVAGGPFTHSSYITPGGYDASHTLV
jgi:hypothetical protein